MLFSMLLLSMTVMSHDNNVEARIKELEEIQFNKELEISNLNELIVKKSKSFGFYKDRASYYLRLVRKESESSKPEESIEQIITNFDIEFENAQDIKQLIETSFVSLDPNNSYESFQIWTLFAVLELRLMLKLLSNYEARVQELIKINAELTHLRN